MRIALMVPWSVLKGSRGPSLMVVWDKSPSGSQPCPGLGIHFFFFFKYVLRVLKGFVSQTSI